MGREEEIFWDEKFILLQTTRDEQATPPDMSDNDISSFSFRFYNSLLPQVPLHRPTQPQDTSYAQDAPIIYEWKHGNKTKGHFSSPYQNRYHSWVEK
jgi:hypothetical protein